MKTTAVLIEKGSDGLRTTAKNLNIVRVREDFFLLKFTVGKQ